MTGSSEESGPGMPSPERRREVEALLLEAARWAEGRPDVVAAGVAGSWACGAARDDSDVDLVLLTEEVDAYAEGDDWIEGLGATRLIRRRDWGAITEHRLLLPSGLEVEVAIGRPGWASTGPVDAGTRRTVRDGLRILYDPEGLLGSLVAACGSPAGAE